MENIQFIHDVFDIRSQKLTQTKILMSFTNEVNIFLLLDGVDE